MQWTLIGMRNRDTDLEQVARDARRTIDLTSCWSGDPGGRQGLPAPECPEPARWQWMGVSGWKMMALPRRDWHRRGPCVALAVGRQARLVAEVRASDAEAMIVHLKLLIAKVRHERFGAFSEVME